MWASFKSIITDRKGKSTGIENNLLEETEKLLTKYAYKIIYVPHEVIEDHNVTYNVTCDNKVITTNAAKQLSIPMNEIWISEMWKPYEKYILFHELREIHYRAEGLSRDEAHKKAVQDAHSLWENEPSFHKMIKEIKETDRRTN